MSKHNFSHPSLPLAPFSEVLRGNETSLKFARISVDNFALAPVNFCLSKKEQLIFHTH